MTETITTSTGKHIEYDRLTKDYAARYEGDLIGYFKTYHAAEMVLDAFAYELLSSPLAQEPSQDAIDYADALLAIAPMLADALDYDTLPDDAPGTDDPDEGPQQRRRCATCRVERLYPAEARPYCCYAPMVRA